MFVNPSEKKQPVIGITGHAGAGHVHSHAGFIQDDSAGFGVVASLMRMAFLVDTTIVQVDSEKDTVTVATADNGIGEASARRGFSQYEQELMQRAIGQDGICSQSVAFRSFGRIYGQGVLEAPVAFQTAVCRAVVDTFARRFPGEIMVSEEGPACNVGACMGAMLDINGIEIAALAVLNSTRGGIGPAEDLEGNVSLADKGRLMRALHLDRLPTIIIESKAFIPSLCRDLEQNAFVVRYSLEFDNPVVGEALAAACRNLRIPFTQLDTAYPRNTGEMANATVAFAERIIEMGQQIKHAETAKQKVELIADLALLVSQDAGGISYMTSRLHEVVAGGGLVPGTAAVLSLLVPQTAIERNLLPEVKQQDIDSYIEIIIKAVGLLSKNLDDAKTYLERRTIFDNYCMQEKIS